MAGASSASTVKQVDSTGIRIGIVTALPVEFAAMEALLDNVAAPPVKQDPHHYRSGSVPSKATDRPHQAVLCLPHHDGTRSAAAACADMLRSFPELAVVIVCGIAAGVPQDRADGTLRRSGIRLGDVVVGIDGIVDFGHVRQIDGVAFLRRSVQGLSAALVQADRHLQTVMLAGHKQVEPWLAELAKAQQRLPQFRRPSPGPTRGTGKQRLRPSAVYPRCCAERLRVETRWCATRSFAMNWPIAMVPSLSRWRQPESLQR